MVNRLVLTAAVAASIAMPLLANAAEQPSWNSPTATTYNAAPAPDVGPMSLAPSAIETSSTSSDTIANSSASNQPDRKMLTLAGGGSKLHGFGALSIQSQYITPRGLVALESSPQFQAVFGLSYSVYQAEGFIEDVSVNGGVWTNLNPHPSKSTVTGADTVAEVDVWVGFDVKFAQKWKFSYSLEAWYFPDLTSSGTEINPETEYNMQFKFSYDDSEYLKQFALNPYVNVFWNFTGSSSPVVAQATAQGKNYNTAYVELGIAPSYTYKGISELPITFTLPTYVSIGDSAFWGKTSSGERSNWGVFSIGLKISAPLTFIPQDFGSWNVYAGVTYYNTLNPALTSINAGTGADSNLVLGYMGIGFGF